MEDALSRKPGEVAKPDDADIEDSSSRLCELQDHIAFGAVKEWLQVVVPHLVLIDCIEAIKSPLSFSHPIVALACKRCSKQDLDPR